MSKVKEKIKVSKEVRKWINIAREDLEVAKELFKSGRYLYATFFCQQAIEKSFKAVIENKSKEDPPYIHNLVRLANLAYYPANERIVGYLEDLNLHYIKGRYMMRRDKLPGNKKVFTAKMVIVAEEILRWSSQKIK